MIVLSSDDKKRFKKYLVDFFHNAYNGNKLSSKDEVVNFNFFKKYDFYVDLSYGKGNVAKIPWIIFIRMDTQEYKASYGVYVYCGIKRENREIVVCIGESEDKTVNYLARNKVDEYNAQFNHQVYNYSNLSNDINLIMDKIILNMQWFKELPLNEIQDININTLESKSLEVENNVQQISSKMENKNMPLNQILYGPPGTGKTYHTIDKALEILGENLESRDEKKAKFDEYVKNGQIVFTTFHQSYGYEEFVEGIKPSLNSDENSQINYKVKDGIFKELCKKALENRDDIESFNFYINDLKEKTKEDANNPEKYFQLPNTKYSIQYRGGKTFRIKFDDMSKNHKDYPVSIDNIEKLYKTSNIDEIYNSAYVKAILNYLKSQGLKDYKEKDEKINLPYIIIIDEINRGNVSKIFGELITLIEPSKRLGNEEALELTLPYSGEKFGVPKNVYIIGTMNTADRSITSLDTALRRRFEFVEMMPNSDLLNNVFICKDVENPNEDEDYLGDDAKTEGYAEILQNILISINKRIEFLLDREKTIGHAFFMSEAVKFNKNNWIKPDEYEEDWYVLSISKLKKVFQNKIIPLLQEYFYNDYALINEVLNHNGMIKEDKKDDKYLQKIKNLDSVNSERSIYNIASFDDKIWDKIEIYQAIYNDEIANKLKNENE
ncbi:AAA domain-containing protein [Campylobacter jejuni]|uniref:McrB family protein n=1 Tax=Campylobacter jejuni TaxID=197 RepID=UPI001436BBD1|nr:AAA family ATPase [Campylobacter jejuni]QIW72680.1 AAA domain-containing protein [Campylobacter jejuni]QIW74231.1 AAA domain-containing protein [Campylobacter jejuni]QIW75778.1 AAA domain-containing protein [Campylobacter jejuni]